MLSIQWPEMVNIVLCTWMARQVNLGDVFVTSRKDVKKSHICERLVSFSGSFADVDDITVVEEQSLVGHRPNRWPTKNECLCLAVLQQDILVTRLDWEPRVEDWIDVVGSNVDSAVVESVRPVALPRTEFDEWPLLAKIPASTLVY
ncbi:hypothetical protein AUR66_11190 [Haloferax profundi]|uniref:Uncharacterized protein n=1 Tax=Haloferax profundi TaxID=1544718 RepID=A0A0W1SS68_9EURY|nr:hypothetical protein AUR66_11190 [Haloferax profundi]